MVEPASSRADIERYLDQGDHASALWALNEWHQSRVVPLATSPRGEGGGTSDRLPGHAVPRPDSVPGDGLSQKVRQQLLDTPADAGARVHALVRMLILLEGADSTWTLYVETRKRHLEAATASLARQELEGEGSILLRAVDALVRVQGALGALIRQDTAVLGADGLLNGALGSAGARLSHLGLGRHPEVLRRVARALATAGEDARSLVEAEAMLDAPLGADRVSAPAVFTLSLSEERRISGAVHTVRVLANRVRRFLQDVCEGVGAAPVVPPEEAAALGEAMMGALSRSCTLVVQGLPAVDGAMSNWPSRTPSTRSVPGRLRTERELATLQVKLPDETGSPARPMAASRPPPRKSPPGCFTCLRRGQRLAPEPPLAATRLPAPSSTALGLVEPPRPMARDVALAGGGRVLASASAVGALLATARSVVVEDEATQGVLVAAAGGGAALALPFSTMIREFLVHARAISSPTMSAGAAGGAPSAGDRALLVASLLYVADAAAGADAAMAGADAAAARRATEPAATSRGPWSRSPEATVPRQPTPAHTAHAEGPLAAAVALTRRMADECCEALAAAEGTRIGSIVELSLREARQWTSHQVLPAPVQPAPSLRTWELGLRGLVADVADRGGAGVGARVGMRALAISGVQVAVALLRHDLGLAPAREPLLHASLVHSADVLRRLSNVWGAEAMPLPSTEGVAGEAPAPDLIPSRDTAQSLAALLDAVAALVPLEGGADPSLMCLRRAGALLRAGAEPSTTSETATPPVGPGAAPSPELGRSFSPVRLWSAAGGSRVEGSGQDRPGQAALLAYWPRELVAIVRARHPAFRADAADAALPEPETVQALVAAVEDVESALATASSETLTGLAKTAPRPMRLAPAAVEAVAAVRPGGASAAAPVSAPSAHE